MFECVKKEEVKEEVKDSFMSIEIIPNILNIQIPNLTR